MVQFLEKTAEWNSYVRGGATNVEQLGDALIRSFQDIDVAIREHQSLNAADTSGCTAVTAVITPRYIVCSNAGDSRCVLGTNGIAKGLSEDHKPSDDLERKRIENAGGSVQWKRVDGDLAVSRAFGDFQFKARTDLPPAEQKVSCYPDIVVHERCPEDEILLLACDGLWDVMTNNEAIDLARSILLTGERSLEKVAEEMVDVALEKGISLHGYFVKC
jgi:serine/threonine protein phosphatase PrpC